MQTEYDVYHDESQEAGYWHGILLVPRQNRQKLLGPLLDIRRNTGRADPISLKQLKKPTGPLYRCISGWLQVAVGAMIQRLNGRHYSIPTGRSGRTSEFVPLGGPIGARFVLFRIANGLSALTLCSNHATRVETTFRMALKGGLSLFADGNRQLVSSLHFDGHKHYGRRLDLGRILRNMSGEFAVRTDIVLDDATSDHRKENSQPYDDCQLLQLTDILVSGFRTVLGTATNQAQKMVCNPLGALVEKWNRGPKGFRNSRWHNGFCLSEGKIENGEWHFGNPLHRTISNQIEMF